MIPRTKRTQSLNTSCSISTKTIPTASKPNAHKQTSTCTLGVFEIESPRKAENAIRRRSKENIFVGLLLVVGLLLCRESRRLLFFAPGVLFSPSSVILSRYIILCSIRSRRTHRRDKKEQLRRSRARDRQSSSTPFGGSMTTRE